MKKYLLMSLILPFLAFAADRQGEKVIERERDYDRQKDKIYEEQLLRKYLEEKRLERQREDQAWDRRRADDEWYRKHR